MKIKVVIRDNNFSEATKEEMWDVYQKYYAYTKASFMSRIEKNNYYTFYMAGDKIVGFTGLRINDFETNGKKYFTVYFGQTVINSEYRGSSLIQRTGIKICIKFFSKLLTRKTFFWADTLTFRSYLVFAKTLEEYYPSYKSEMPAEVKELRNFLGETYYNGTFCQKRGTVAKVNNVVTDHSAVVRESDLQDKDIAFFAQVNQGHQKGDGLITMGPINSINLFSIVKKIAQRSLAILGTKAKVRPIYTQGHYSKAV